MKVKATVALSFGGRLLILVCGTLTALPSEAAYFEPVSQLGPSFPPPAGGDGDSGMPILSADGRYVAFASASDNLVLNTNGSPIPALLLPGMNVYLRDRTNETTTLVSVDLSGLAGGNADSLPRGISTNGQYVLFESAASDLVAGDTNMANDVFVRDVVNGVTLLVSVNTNGVPGNGPSYDSVMTPDGRFVAFASAASDLVLGDTNKITDVFVRDLLLNTTTLVSVGAASTNSAQANMPVSVSESPAITPDGRYVAFYSSATNLVPGSTAAGNVYVRDLIGGTTAWASAGAGALLKTVKGAPSATSFSPLISDDGQFVAYEVSGSGVHPAQANPAQGLVLRYDVQTTALDLVHTNANVPTSLVEELRTLDMTPDGRFIAFLGNSNDVSGETTCVDLWDADSGAITLISGDTNNAVPTGSLCLWPTLDACGQNVAFLNGGANLTTNALLSGFHLYIRNVAGASTTLVDADTNGLGWGVNPVAVPGLSSNGLVVAFESADGNLVPNDSNCRDDVFVRDLTLPSSELISVRVPALATQTPVGDSALSSVSASCDGRYVAFTSEATNLVANDTNGQRDVFVRDQLNSSNILVSVAANGVCSGDGASTDPSMSGDGRYVAFTSFADNLVPGDTNGVSDVFVRDLQAGATSLVSVGSDGVSFGNGASFSPIISTNGRYVLFHSKAGNLTLPAGSSGIENLFLRDLQLGTNYRLTSLSSTAVIVASMSPDGQFVGYSVTTSSSSESLYVFTAGKVFSANGPFTRYNSLVSISPDGSRLAYITNGSLQMLYFTNYPTNTTVLSGSNCVIATGGLQTSFSSHAGLSFSADGRFLVFAYSTNSSLPSMVNTAMQVYLYDTQTGSDILVSQSYNSANPASGGSSDSPDISPDGRYVVFRSLATNLVAGVASGQPNLFLYDRVAGVTTLLTTTMGGSSPANSRSLAPLFSGDGHTIFFRSQASDLTAGDFNQRGDVFGFPFLYATITVNATPGQGPALSWPATPGLTYQAQFMDNLNNSGWQPVTGSVIITGNQGSITDLAPGLGQRFYRVIGTGQ